MAKVIKRHNLCVATRKYTDASGNEKSVWQRIGEITTWEQDDGSTSRSAELYHMPGIRVSVFEQKAKEDEPKPRAPQSEEINVEDIPF